MTNQKSKKEKIKLTVLIIAIICIVLSAAYLVYDLIWSPYHIKKLNEQFKTPVSQTETTHPGSPTQIQAKYAEFKKQYPDFAGKLEAVEFEMDFPVMQCKDNSYYLKYTIDGVQDKHGALFVDYRNDLVSLNQNTIIYGHNMRDGTQFGKLNMFKKVSNYKSCPVITFNTIYKDYKWKVFAAFLINTKPEDDNGYTFNYLRTSFASEKEFNDYYNEALERSYIITGVDVNANDKILTMSTCSLAFDDSRLVVLARLVRDGENESVDTSKAIQNPNQRFPAKIKDGE